MSMTIQVDYYAAFREQRGRAGESVQTAARTPLELYGELQRQHGFAWQPGSLRVAVNDEFCEWHTPLQTGDRVVFIAPVSGG